MLQLTKHQKKPAKGIWETCYRDCAVHWQHFQISTGVLLTLGIPCAGDAAADKASKGAGKEHLGDLLQRLATGKKRQQIVSDMHAFGAACNVADGLRPDRVSETMGLLRQAAALAENSAIQQEIILHSHRQFALQVSSSIAIIC